MVAYRLRLELADRPGALAGVTSRIAESNANIVSIDVHEIDGTTAVDEIVVEVPDGWSPGLLAESLAESRAGTLLSSRVMTRKEDPVSAALRAVAGMIGAEPDEVDARCRDALLGLAHGSHADVVAVDAAVDSVAVLAVERGGPVVTRIGETGASTGWAMAVLDDGTDPDVVASVFRPLNVRFSATEVSRVEALLRVRRRLLARRTAVSS